MKIKILSQGKEDISSGYRFYSVQGSGLGSYFLDSLYSDIDALLISAGVHENHHGYFRALSKRFPFAIYYRVEGSIVFVDAVLDCRREPAWIRKRLKLSTVGQHTTESEELASVKPRNPDEKL